MMPKHVIGLNRISLRATVSGYIQGGGGESDLWRLPG